MTLELTFRPPFSLSRLLRAQSDESQQEVHWVGQKRELPKEGQGPKNQNRKPEQKKDSRGYRPLASIKLGEVEQAIGLFEHQLVPARASHENWIGKNHFCTFPLKRLRDGRPPLIFGFVQTCYPSDGYLENVEDIELYFPRGDGPPDLIYIHRDEISRHSQRAVQSHAMRVQFKVSVEEQADFERSTPGLAANGFYPEFDQGYYDMLEINDQNRSMHPLFHVIGSRWFQTVPESVQADVRSKIEKLLGWGKYVFNYHPDWLPKEVHTLNRELDFQYGFTPTVLVEPKDPAQTLLILAETRRRLFEEPQNRSS